MTGYIKDHRKELESDIWLMPPLYHRVWQYLKYKVNHDEAEIPMRDGTKFKILPGQHLTSVRGIAKGIGWYEGRVWKEPNPKTIDTILKWLEKTLMISIDSGRGNRQYTLITLLQWALYQSKEDWGNSKVTVEKQLVDINKNVKNDKKENYAEFVTMTEAEHKKLIDAHGIEFTRSCIEVLDNYKGSKGEKYKSDYRAILNWVIKRVKEDAEKAKGFKPTNKQQPNLQIVQPTDQERKELRDAFNKQLERNGVSPAVNI